MKEEIAEHVRLDTMVQLALKSVSDRKDNFRDIILDVSYADLSTIKCFKSEVLEALINIFQNCNDFLGTDEGEIFVRTYPAFHDGNSDSQSIVLEVIDNGPGIEEKLMNSVFELGVSTKTGSGYGFGLHIAKRLVESNGGKIRIESPASLKRFSKRIGPGTRVEISFPLM